VLASFRQPCISFRESSLKDAVLQRGRYTLLVVTYVLVHGGWHGGWCWNQVAPLLREAGHHVLTPTMTGLGERVHLASPQVDLALHIEDIVAVLEWEDLRHVILVGHSSAGAVISGVAQRIPQRLARLVYLDAFVLREGEGVLDLVPEAARMDLLALTEQHGQGWQVPIPPLFVLGLTEAADIEWVVPKLRPQPLQTLRQPLRGDTEVVAAIPTTYIKCKGDTGPFGESDTRAKAAGWKYLEIATGHDAMVTAPTTVADLLLNQLAS
jgi:pimeloyl-ACP methyl ester carboxylesterase